MQFPEAPRLIAIIIVYEVLVGALLLYISPQNKGSKKKSGQNKLMSHPTAYYNSRSVTNTIAIRHVCLVRHVAYWVQRGTYAL